MINQQLLDYIKQQLGKNINKEEIKNILMGNGWDASDVEEGFKTLTPKPITQPIYTPPITPVTPVTSITPVATPVLNPQPQPQQSTPNFINPLTSSNLQPESQKHDFVSSVVSPISSPVTPVESPVQEIEPTLPQFSSSENNSPEKKSSWNSFFHAGRIGRLRYFLSALIFSISAMLISVLLLFLAGFLGFLGIFLGLLVVVLIINFFLAVRRFHDLGQSGWHTIALIIPFYNIYLILGLLLRCGTEGPNQSGDDPLPAEKNHNNFANKLGSSVTFKIIVTILLSILFIVFSYQKNLVKIQAGQQINQNTINSISIPTSNTNNSSATPTPAPNVPVINTPTTTPPTTTNNPVIVTISLGSQSASQTLSISFKNILTFTNVAGIVTKGADIAVVENGNSQELMMNVGEKNVLGTQTITLTKVSGNSATFSIQNNF